MDTEIQKGKKKAQHDIVWLHNRVIEPGACFRNLFLPTYGILYFKVNELLWKPYFYFITVLLLSLFPGNEIFGSV